MERKKHIEADASRQLRTCQGNGVKIETGTGPWLKDGDRNIHTNANTHTRTRACIEHLRHTCNYTGTKTGRHTERLT